MEKRVAIVLCSTSDQIFAAGNVLIGLKKHFSLPETEYDIIIYVDKQLNKKDENALKSIYKNIIITIYNNVFSKELLSSDVVKTWTKMAYARYECLSLLDEYKQVIYLDTDILILKDIIYLTTLTQKDIYAYIYDNETILDVIKTNRFIKNFNETKYDLNKKNCCSAELIFNDKIQNRDKIKEWMYNKTVELQSSDQMILNLMLQEFNIDYGCFEKEYCKSYSGVEETPDDCILHSPGGCKFWNCCFHDEWNKNNKVWAEFGGTEYNLEKYIKTKKMINKIAWFIPTQKLRNKIRESLYKLFHIRFF